MQLPEARAGWEVIDFIRGPITIGVLPDSLTQRRALGGLLVIGWGDFDQQSARGGVPRMSTSLTPPERETVITFNDADDVAHVFTWQRTIITAIGVIGRAIFGHVMFPVARLAGTDGTQEPHP